MLAPVGQPDPGKGCRCLASAPGSCNTHRDERRLNVFLGGQSRDQVEGLEDEPDRCGSQCAQLALAHRREVVAVQFDPPRSWTVEGSQDLQEGCLAVSGWSLHGEPLTVLDPEVHAGQGMHRRSAFPVVLRHCGQLVHATTPSRSCNPGLSDRADRVQHALTEPGT